MTHHIVRRGTPLVGVLPLVLSLLLLIACSGPRDAVIPTDINRWDSDLRPVIDRLTGDDRRLAVAYLDRERQAASLSGQPVPAGVTVGQAIDLQRKFEQDQAKQRLQSRERQDQQEQARKEAEGRAAAVFGITLLDKKIIPADLASGNRSDQAAFTFQFANLSDQELREVKGDLHLSDSFFGTELKVITLDYRDPLAPGESVTWTATIQLSPSAIIDQRVRNEELSQIKVVLTPDVVAFADGSMLDLPVAIAQP